MWELWSSCTKKSEGEFSIKCVCVGVCGLTVRVSLSSLSGAVFTSTDVIVPTISGEGTVFSAITWGFSKYRACHINKHTHTLREKYSKTTDRKSTLMSGTAYHYFRQVFVNLLYKVQEVMNLVEKDRKVTLLTIILTNVCIKHTDLTTIIKVKSSKWCSHTSWEIGGRNCLWSSMIIRRQMSTFSSLSICHVYKKKKSIALSFLCQRTQLAIASMHVVHWPSIQDAGSISTLMNIWFITIHYV